jgi:hypothetical protein
MSVFFNIIERILFDLIYTQQNKDKHFSLYLRKCIYTTSKKKDIPEFQISRKITLLIKLDLLSVNF